MADNIYGIFSFESSHYAIAAEQAVSQFAEARLVPIPPELSAGCGLALRVSYENIEKIIKCLNKNEIYYEDAKKLEIKNRKRVITDL